MNFRCWSCNDFYYWHSWFSISCFIDHQVRWPTNVRSVCWFHELIAECPKARFQFKNQTTWAFYNFLQSSVGNIGSLETCPCESLCPSVRSRRDDRLFRLIGRYRTSLCLFTLLYEFIVGGWTLLQQLYWTSNNNDTDDNNNNWTIVFETLIEGDGSSKLSLDCSSLHRFCCQ